MTVLICDVDAQQTRFLIPLRSFVLTNQGDVIAKYFGNGYGLLVYLSWVPIVV